MFTFIAIHEEGLTAGVAPSASTAVPPPLNSMCACVCVRVHTRARTPHPTSRESCSAMHAGPSARSILEPMPFKAPNPRAGARPVLAASVVLRPRGRSLFRPTKGQVKRAATSLAAAPRPAPLGTGKACGRLPPPPPLHDLRRGAPSAVVTICVWQREGRPQAVCAGRRAGPGSASRIWGVGSLSPSQRSRSVLSPRSPGACDRHSVWVPACFTDDITRAPSRSRALKFQGGKYVLWEKVNAENHRQLFWARFRLRRSN